MAKKLITNAQPKVSNIPIPKSDNPLVIDLPDGQKLVLGKLNAGSVIEVATWRGTGRPDSRTNRLMLGMTDANAPQVTSTQSVESENTELVKKITLPWGNISLPAIKLPKVDLKNMKKLLLALIANFKKALERTRELSPVETTAELDINAWIESISREAEIKSTRARKPSTNRKSSPPASKSAKKKR
jgi:hypothetical protein